ncbi:MAG: nitrite/sulfite reductase [Candidatus Binatia bacterium]
MRPTDDELRAALRTQAERFERYRQGTMTDAEFRPLRVSYGLYYELEHTSYLQRIKLPGGVLTVAQADELADLADEYARGRIHFTTRQNVQLHWVGLDKVMEIYERLHAVGITTRGAAGDSVRNVTMCAHAGIWPAELFDVTPYAHATHDHFLFHPLNLTLPRKFKIAFSSCPQDCAQARINDIGFFPYVQAGRRGFSVYAAGGLGPQPFLAQLIREFVPVEDTLIIVEAILHLWSERGERKNRKRARMKYLFQRLGAERFVAAMDELSAKIEAAQGPELRAELTDLVEGFKESAPHQPPSPLPQSGDTHFSHWLRTNAFAQRQEGYYAGTILLPLGEISGAQLRGVANLARRFGAGGLRASNDQNLMVSWIPGARVEEFYRGLCALDLGSADALHITDVVSCPGADYCSLAISRSMAVAGAIQEQLRAADSVDGLGLFRIKASGCPNSCGQHHIGDIGLTGLSVKGADGQPHPHYSMLLGGAVGETTAAIGKRVPGRFREEDVPQAVAALAAYFQRERRAGEDFSAFVQRIGLNQLTRVARQPVSVAH